MAHIQQHFLKAGRTLAVLSLALSLIAGSEGLKFYADDPLWREPPPLPVMNPRVRPISDAYTTIDNTVLNRSGRPPLSTIPPAGAVNTLGEVPDSDWYTNRHSGVKRMSIEELIRGPITAGGPTLDRPLRVLNGKTEGATPGLVVEDSSGRRFVIKFDPPHNPRMTTAADVIGSKFFYALGYNVPENFIFLFERTQLALEPNAVFVDAFGKRRTMREADLEDILARVLREQDGRYRAMASLYIPGKMLGPFLYSGTRSDDPNDLIPHENRRDLRGLFVFAAWLNHYDTTALNTLDTLITVDGIPRIRHHLLDFGSILGSSSQAERDPRSGYSYLFEFGEGLTQIFTLGLKVPGWQKARYPNLPEIGRFEGEVFDPHTWKPIFPNPAFQYRLPDDTYWAAKKVMAFTDEEIRAIVKTGQFEDIRSVEWLTKVLVERRDKIGRAFFEKVMPLDNFTVTEGELQFEDLAVKYGYTKPRNYSIDWSHFNNETKSRSPLPDKGPRIPAAARGARPGSYFVVEISAGDRRTVSVYLRREEAPAPWKVVGIERTW